MAKDLFPNKLFFSFLYCLVSFLGWGQTFSADFADISGTGGSDGLWSGTIASAALSSYTTGGTWTLSNAYKGYQCPKLGTGSALGSIQTPPLSGLSGDGTLTFKAGAWNGDSTTLNISISGGGTLSASSVTLANAAYTNYSINVTGVTSTTQIKFTGQKAINSRFFIDDINITVSSTNPKATITSTPVSLSENNLNGATLSLTLQNETFNTTTLTAANFSLANGPTGVSISSVSYVDATHANVTLNYNDTDFDTSVSNFALNINNSVLTTSTSTLVSNALNITAVTETLSATALTAFGNVCLNSSSIPVNSFVLSGTNLKTGNISLAALSGYSYSDVLTGPFSTTFTFSNSSTNLGGGKTIYVKFTPVSAVAYNGNIAISGGAANSINVAASGTGVASATANVTTGTVTTFGATTATLVASAATFGACPNTTTKGFVYSVLATNPTPQNGGTGVTTTTQTLGTAGSFTSGQTGFLEGTTYAYQAYLYDGATYTYGGVQTFTTTVTNPNIVSNIKTCLNDDSGTISWAAPTTGSTPTGYMVFAVAATTVVTGTLTNGVTDYSNADSNFSSLTNAANPASLGKILYKGTATSVNITGLTENATYSFLVLAYREGPNYRGFSSATFAGSKSENNLAQDDVKTFTGTPSNGQVTLNWTYNSALACFDEVMIVANEGLVNFTPNGDGSAYTANSTWQNSGTQVVYKGTANSKAIDGLTNLTQYCFKIFVRRGSNWSDGVSLCVTPDVNYCASSGVSTNNSGILNVNFSTINNTTSAANGYADYTSTVANVVLGQSYDLSVNINTNGNYTSYVKAWIDWNHDGTFDNSATGNEAYILGTVTNNTNGQPTFSPLTITVPTDAKIANTRMRIVTNSENTIGTYTTPCQGFTYGEVEDYTLNVVRPSAAEINIKGGNITIPNGFDSPYGLNNTLFATTNLNTDSVEKTFTIENIGAAILNLTGTPVIQITGANAGDFIVTQQVPSTVAASGVVTSTVNFKIKFHPTAAGTRTAYVNILNDDSDENPYSFSIQGNGNCTSTYTANFYPISGTANTVVTITSLSDLTGATVTLGNMALTATVTASQINTVIPAGAVDDYLIVHLSNGCIIKQFFDVISSVNSGCQLSAASSTPADLFISQVTDSGTDAMSYIEIFNGTGSAVNLGAYNLKIYNNGATTQNATINLSNISLANNNTYVVAIGLSNPSPFCTAISGGDGSLANQQSVISGINFNYQGDVTKGHDYIALFKSSTKIDSWGVYKNESWGTSLNLEGNGASFSRKPTVIAPNTTFSISDWNIDNWGTTCDSQDYSGIGVYQIGERNPPSVTSHPNFSPSCQDLVLSVSANEGFEGGNPLAYQWYYLPPNSPTWTALSDGGVYSGTATNNLTISSSTGLNNYQYYCQIRENDATCYKASNAVLIKDSETTWDGTSWSNGNPGSHSKVIIKGTYNTATNGALNICTLTVDTGGNIIIKKDYPVTVQNEVINKLTADKLLIESDGNLVQNNDLVSNIGTITAIRNIKIRNTASREEYNYLISPIKNFNIKNIFNNDPAFIKYTLYHNELTEKFYVSSGAYIPGRGLAVKEPYAISNGVSIEFTDATGTYAPAKFVGEPANGIIDFTLAKAGNGYNLVGNPYPSTIDLKTLYENNNTRINPLTTLPEDPIESTFNFWDNSNNSIYVQQGTSYSGNSYARYNAVSDTGTPAGTNKIPDNSDLKINRYAKVGQGFMVKTKAAGKILQFKNNIRVANNNNAKFFSGKSTRKSSEVKDRFWISLVSPNDIVNTQAVVYFDGGSNDFAADDSEVQSLSSNLFYSIVGDRKVLINGRSTFADTDVIPVGCNIFTEGTYKIQLAAKQGVFENGQNIYLKDKETGVSHNLGESPYVFTAVSGNISNRFEIVYQTKTLGSAEFFKNKDLQVYKEEQDYVIKAPQTITQLHLYDSSGKLILSAEPNKKELRILAHYLANGLYLVKVNMDGMINSMKFIKQ